MATTTFQAGVESVTYPGYYEWSNVNNWSAGLPTTLKDAVFGASSPNCVYDGGGDCYNLDGSAYTNEIRGASSGGQTLYVWGSSYVWGASAQGNDTYKFAVSFHDTLYELIDYSEPTTVTVTNGDIKTYAIKFDNAATYNVTDDVYTNASVGGTFNTYDTCIVNMAGQLYDCLYLNIKWGSQVIFAVAINRPTLAVNIDDWISPSHGPGASLYLVDDSTIKSVVFGNVSNAADVTNTVTGDGVINISGSITNYVNGVFTNPNTVLNDDAIHYITPMQSSIEFEDLTLDPGAQVRVYVGKTIDVLGEFSAPGTADSGITIWTSTDSSSSYINVSSCGTVSYVTTTDIDSSGGTTVNYTYGTMLRTVNWVEGGGTAPSSTPSVSPSASPSGTPSSSPSGDDAEIPIKFYTRSL